MGSILNAGLKKFVKKFLLPKSSQKQINESEIKMALHNVVSKILNVPASILTDNTGPKQLSEWDSLRHIQIVLTIEQEYDVQFTPVEITSIYTIGDVRDLLVQKGISIADERASI